MAHATVYTFSWIRLLHLKALLHPTDMRKTAWIWFAGFAAWVVDGIISLRLHSFLHAKLAFFIAMVFFAAGLFYWQQRR